MEQTYIVKKGDTLYGISNQFGVSVADILKINNVDPTNLQIGEVVKIPIKGGTNPNATFIYTVVKGDTLYKIALKYKTTIDELIKLNNLKSSNLQIGQKLVIPETFISTDVSIPNFINYIVIKGDNLYAIARKYNTSIDQIKSDNALSSNILSIGQNLKIRVDNDNVLECFGNEYNSNENNTLYIVKKGDNLYSIAKKYNTTIDSIKKKNNLSSNLLSIGQELII